MGAVYRAYDQQLERHVAIKVLPPDSLDSRRILARFQREARAASALNHPNICTIFDTGEHKGAPFIVMELLEGRTLETVLREGALAIERVRELGALLADALQAAHSRGIVHRDIKPSNIMLLPGGIPKILDFGVAKQADNEHTLQDATSLTQAGSLLGTARYIAPEQALGQPVDGRSDLFSLGVVLYEMVSGRLPFSGDSAVAQINAILNAEPAPLTSPSGPIPKPLLSLILQLLSKNPEERPSSSSEVADSLRGVAPESSAPGSVTTRKMAAIICSLLGVISLFLIWQFAQKTPLPASPRSLALLPFEYRGTAGQRPNATMLPALLAESLRLNSTLEIAPFETSRQYPPNPELTNAIRELRVSWMLLGDMSVTDPLYTLQLRLVQAASDPVWKGNYHGEVADMLGQASRISADIAAALGEDQIDTRGLLGIDPAAVRHYLEGKRYLDGWDVESNHERALQAFSQAIGIKPDFGEAHSGLALALWRQWEETAEPALVERAQASATRAVEASPGVPESHLARGIVHLGRGQLNEAVLSFETAQSLAPADDAVCRHIARAFARLGRAADAEAMYRKAIALRPDLWQNYNALGNFLLAQGRFEEAEEPYRQIIRLRPQSDIGHNNLALAHLSLGQFDEAEVHLLAAVAIQPNMAGHSNLGFVYYSTGRYGEAAEQFIQATQFSEDEGPWLNLGDAYRQLGEEENAGKAYRQAIQRSRSRLQIDPEDAELRSRLGYSLAGAEECDAAAGQLELAQATAAENPWIDYYSAVSYAICGQDERATTALLEAIGGGLRADVETNPDLRRLFTNPAVRRALQ